MSENAGIKNWRNWVPVVVVGIIVISVLIGVQNNKPTEGNFADSVHLWFRHFIGFAESVLWTAGPCFITATILIHHRRLLPLAWFGFLFCILRVTIEAVYYFGDETVVAASYSTTYRLVNVTAAAAETLFLVMLLLFPRLKKPGFLVQITAVVAALVVFTSFALIFMHWMSAAPLSIQIIRSVAGVVGLLSVPAVGALIVFRSQIVPHTPPNDAAANLNLTCPRCQSQQCIPTNGGRCKSCQLDIFIALKEGACRKCHYPLRGLTSMVCPECGTAVVVGSA